MCAYAVDYDAYMLKLVVLLMAAYARCCWLLCCWLFEACRTPPKFSTNALNMFTEAKHPTKYAQQHIQYGKLFESVQAWIVL